MSPFWSGFAVGAVLFSVIGSAIGILAVALLCHIRRNRQRVPEELVTGSSLDFAGDAGGDLENGKKYLT